MSCNLQQLYMDYNTQKRGIVNTRFVFKDLEETY